MSTQHDGADKTLDDSAYALEDLDHFITDLFIHAGLDKPCASVMAEVFLEADLMGFGSHGINLVATNLEMLVAGKTRLEGEPYILADHGSTFNWDADFLPGPWVVTQALTAAMKRVTDYGVVTATIRRSQHIGCLAAYCPRIIEAGYVVMITCSSPLENYVCAHGGLNPVFSVNPLAFAAPTEGEPLLFDISLSVTAGGQVLLAKREGRRLPEPCIKDHLGHLSDDPNTLFKDPRASILPIGGVLHGHKGAALNIMSEVLSMALGGYGRASVDPSADGSSNSVFLQVIDPAVFGGLDRFKRELTCLKEKYMFSLGTVDQDVLRFPGQRAWQLREDQRLSGVSISDRIMADISPWEQRWNIKKISPIVEL